MSTITIYKASAGSGKTYRLVAEFLKLALKNPVKYKHILAVTFTNKATSEMKERIVGDLYKISLGEKNDLVELISSETDLDEHLIRSNAKLVLSNILHDYDHFSISTIDSFFQKVLKGFTRELGLHGAFEVELDQEMLIAEACDRLLLQVDTNKDLENWLIEMSEFQLSQGKDWQLNQNINALAKEITNEKFLEFVVGHPDMQEGRKKIRELNADVQKFRQWFKNECKERGENALEIIERNGLSTSSFSGGSRSFANYFNTLAQFVEEKLEPTDTVRKACNNPEAWKTKGKKELHAAIDTAYSDGLNRALDDSVGFVLQHYPKLITAGLISQNLYALGVLTVLMTELRSIGKERNALLISESNQLLRTVISDNDAPFIYEKTGNFYHHFMIDEFQDTSGTQWNNFKPLIINALSEGNSNLVVGDVKQSIYRWRNGDWGLLENQLKMELARFKVNEVSLKSNWRSAPQVVAFNNYLFSRIPQTVQEVFNKKFSETNSSNPFSDTIASLFSDANQTSNAANKEGEVRVSFFEIGPNEESFQEQSVEKMISEIERLQKSGYRAGDMAILIRQNNESKYISKALAARKNNCPEPGINYELISDDSLFLAHSSLVKFVVAMFNHVLQPWNNIWTTSAIYEFEDQLLPQLKRKGLAPERIISSPEQQLSIDQMSTSSSLFDQSVMIDYFPFVFEQPFSPLVRKWSNLSPFSLLTELETLYGLGLIDEEQTNLQAFRDVIAEFSYRETTALFRFIDWWNEKGKKTKLQTGINRDALTIMTIHKSKGLEFPVVFIPFCNWSLVPSSTKGNILWCETAGSGFEHLPVLPVNFKSDLAKSTFSKAYYHELMLSNIDNLNLLYVACTRAIEGLFINTTRNRKNADQKNLVAKPVEIKDVATLLESVFYSDTSIDPVEKLNESVFGIGELKNYLSQPKFNPTIDLSTYHTKGNRITGNLKIKTNYDEFWSVEGMKRKDRINRGEVIHEIMSNIVCREDINHAPEKLFFEGKIEREDLDEIRENIHHLLENPMVEAWFDGTYRIYTERDIVLPGGHLFRPDRVMEREGEVLVVDYKTSMNVNTSHRNQVRKYVSILEAMGKVNVKGYVWYLQQEVLLNINDQESWMLTGQLG